MMHVAGVFIKGFSNRFPQSCLARHFDEVAYELAHFDPDWEEGWSFAFRPPSKEFPWKKSDYSHENLCGFCIRSPDGAHFYQSYEAALLADGEWALFDRKLPVQFYERHLGIDLKRKLKEKQHELVGETVTFKWIGVQGVQLFLTAVVDECFSSYLPKEGKIFRLVFDGLTTEYVNAVGIEGSDPVPRAIEILESSLRNLLTLSQPQFFKEIISSSRKLIPPPFVHSMYYYPAWVVPEMWTTVANDKKHSARAFIAGVGSLEFYIDSSTIPGAGQGLFVKQVNETSSVSSNIVLPKGLLIDIGIYCPCGKEEIKNEALMNMKNFIHNHEPSSWCFDHPGNEEIVYDVSNEWNGTLSERSKLNILVYANETDGSTYPTLHVKPDIKKGIHYLMGHDFTAESDFEIPGDRPLELQVDYGEMYEDVRVRKGYPRVEGEKLKRKEDRLRNLNEILLKDVDHWSVDKLSTCVEYAESILQFPDQCNSFREPLFVYVLKMMSRLRAILEEMSSVDISNPSRFNDNGFTRIWNQSRNADISVTSFADDLSLHDLEKEEFSTCNTTAPGVIFNRDDLLSALELDQTEDTKLNARLRTVAEKIKGLWDNATDFSQLKWGKLGLSDTSVKTIQKEIDLMIPSGT